MKKRICPQCESREVEKYCHICSECRQNNIDFAHDVYNASAVHKERARIYGLKNYQQTGLKTLRRKRPAYEKMLASQ